MKNIIISLLAIAVIGGVGLAVVMGTNSDDGDSSENNTSNTTSNSSQSDSSNESSSDDSNNSDDDSDLSNISSLKDLIGLGRQYQCSFSSTENGVTNSGKIYTDGTNLRGEYKTNIEGADQDFNMIRTKDNTYIWQVNTSEGYIYKNVDVDTDDLPNNTASDNQSLDIEEDIDLQCSRWSGSRGFFDRPGDVDFQDISANINQINEATQGLEDLKKEACEAIPDEASKQLCLENI